MRKQKGITLISLVITVIVLVILSAVSIYLTLGNNGILNKAEYAKNETTKQTATEKMNLKITTAQINTYTEFQRMPTLKELAITLDADSEIEYVNGSKTVASLADIDFTTAESIFTKLVEFPYEFEINSSLQLASIDGVDVATNTTSNAKIKSLINKEDGVYNTTEEGYVFATPTTQTNIVSNNIIELTESIETYDFIEFEMEIYYLEKYMFPVTQIISTEQIKNNYNNTNTQKLENSLMVVHNVGDTFNRVICCFKDNHTIVIESRIFKLFTLY